MEALLGILTLVGFGTSGVLLMKLAQKKDPAPAALKAAPQPSKDLDAARAEVGQLKGELAKKQKTIDELREEAKKKARREGKKAAKEGEHEAAADEKAESSELKKLKAAAVALEAQLAELTKDKLRAVRDAEQAIKERLQAELERAKAEAKKLEATLDELRASIKKKAEARPDVPGSGLDLKSLPTDAVQELARYYRKGEEFERLYHIAQGQLQLEKDKLADLQRRYYAVCRELAVAAAGPRQDGALSDDEAKAVAERVVSGTDAMLPKAAPSEAGEAKKKRRRRRKKKPGAPGQEAAADGADEGADDCDDYHDEGDDDVGGADAAANEPVAAQAESA